MGKSAHRRWATLPKALGKAGQGWARLRISEFTCKYLLLIAQQLADQFLFHYFLPQTGA